MSVLDTEKAQPLFLTNLFFYTTLVMEAQGHGLLQLTAPADQV